MEENEFKVGDRVRITKSRFNWNSTSDINMDQFVDQIHVITGTDPEGRAVQFEDNSNNINKWDWNYHQSHFVKVEEPEFVLPEKWCVLRNASNARIINQWFIDNNHGHPHINYSYVAIDNVRHGYNSFTSLPEGYTSITFEQFQQYVLNPQPVIETPKVFEPLPQYQITGIINSRIVQVINNEGSLFEITDEICMLRGHNMMLRTSAKIIRFRHNKAKTDICAVFDEKYPNGVSISKLQHYIKPKVVEPVFTLPERWYVRVTEDNLEVLSRWRFDQFYPNNKLTTNNIVGMGSGIFDNGRIYKGHNPLTHTLAFGQEITFEQFNQYVLGIPPIVEPVVEETMLEKAMRLYPVGTRYKNAYRERHNSEFINTVTHHQSSTRPLGIYSGNYWICHNGVWGEIINE